MEAFCTELRNTAAIPSDCFQFLTSCRVVTLFSHFVCKTGISLCKGNYSLTAFNNRIKENSAFYCITFFCINSRKCRFCFFDNTVITDSENQIIINSNMPDTVVEIVSGSKDIALYCINSFGTHIRSRKLTCGFSLPVSKNLLESLFRILCEHKGVSSSCFNSIKFVLNPLK